MAGISPTTTCPGTGAPAVSSSLRSICPMVPVKWPSRTGLPGDRARTDATGSGFSVGPRPPGSWSGRSWAGFTRSTSTGLASACSIPCAANGWPPTEPNPRSRRPRPLPGSLACRREIPCTRSWNFIRARMSMPQARSAWCASTSRPVLARPCNSAPPGVGRAACSTIRRAARESCWGPPNRSGPATASPLRPRDGPVGTSWTRRSLFPRPRSG